MKTINFLVFGMILLLVGFVSAEVNFVGTVYKDSTPITGLANVDIFVTCNGTSSPIAKSETDGAYGTSLGACSNGDALVYTLSLSNYESTSYGLLSGSYTGTYNSSNAINLPSGDIYVADFVLAKKVATNGGGSNGGGSNGGGSSGSSPCRVQLWDCALEWSECANGSQTRICNSNCATSRIETQACVIEELDVSGFSFEDQETDVSETGGFFSTITGAVTGVNGAQATGIAVALIFILLIGGFIIVRKKKLKK